MCRLRPLRQPKLQSQPTPAHHRNQVFSTHGSNCGKTQSVWRTMTTAATAKTTCSHRAWSGQSRPGSILSEPRLSAGQLAAAPKPQPGTTLLTSPAYSSQHQALRQRPRHKQPLSRNRHQHQNPHQHRQNLQHLNQNQLRPRQIHLAPPRNQLNHQRQSQAHHKQKSPLQTIKNKPRHPR